jgi:hypothetical protein
LLQALLFLASLSFATDVDLHPRETAILDALEATDPALVDTLLELRETRPELYRKKLHHFAQVQQKKAQHARLRNDPDMARAKAAILQSEAQLIELLAAYQETDRPKERTSIEADLRDEAHTLFARKADLKRLHLEHQQAELDAAREQLEAFEANRDAEVETWLKHKLPATPSP